ncbi:transcriptional regulator [Ferrimonas balearica]|uniref:winged helix-turn-helix domain-containing protein n=1 Tax=Ferrimonas balearica TaxID=44012 RepID=UPI001C999ECF|nr:winged helix-turn-helix domain-containing protein [Ferrimonas balearica]MBY5920576.1 winged helix-turn-helix domain-containing protein [Ferrimonas balearica]MBY5996739.1 winged helix-turn-helix domain-containing protein [Ferrimonas balearica]
MQLSQNLQIDEARRELIDARDGSVHPLSFAELAILKELHLHWGEVVDKDRLTDVGWPGRVVAQSSLTQCISTLRRKLQSHKEVELKTIPRHGYCLCSSECQRNPETHSHIGPEQKPPPYSLSRSVSWTQLGAWALVPALLMVLVFLHSSGLFARAKQRLQLLDAPQVAEVVVEPIQVGQNTNLAYQVVFDVDQDMESVTPQQFVANWRHVDQVMPRANQQRSFIKQSADFDSIALCMNYQDGCKDRIPLNLVKRHQTQPQLDLSWLQQTKLRMEQVTYNKILLDRFEGPSDGLTEEVYRADVYYYGDSDNVVRSDMRFSLVFESDNRGKVIVAACFTDAVNWDTSMRYEFSGSFNAYDSQVDGRLVRRFQVDVDSQQFNRPGVLTEEMAVIYRELQKAVLSQKQLVLHQLQQDEGSGVWSLPLWGDTMVWATRAELKL